MTHTPTRRLLALLLAVATVFSLLSMSVSAADEQTGPELKLVSTATEPLKKGDSFTRRKESMSKRIRESCSRLHLKS